MNSQITEQALNLIQKSKKILLLTHARADADGLGSMISMYLALKELGKQATAVTNDPTPDTLDFLPSMKIVQNNLASVKDFIITLDCSRTLANKIKYNLEDNRVNIIISPKNGQFSDKDVSFSQGVEEQYDLIMTFDTGNLEHLGPLYDQNAELFFKTPLINVDHHASNTEFGQVNFVDVTASSATQLVYELLLAFEKQWSKKFITPDIATLLLAGLITDTGSFQHANTSPQAMEVAAELLDLGARQQEIIKNIYKTKKLSTLKLWGIVLSKVQVDPVYRMVWSSVSRADLLEAGANSEETGNIIDDLLSNAPGAEVIMLIKHGEDDVIGVSMRSTSNQVDVGRLCAEMGGGGHVRAAGFKVRDGRSFEQAMSDVISRVREYQSQRLNIHLEDLEKAQTAAKTNGKKPEIQTKKSMPAQESASVKKETVLEFPAKSRKAAPKPPVTAVTPAVGPAKAVAEGSVKDPPLSGATEVTLPAPAAATAPKAKVKPELPKKEKPAPAKKPSLTVNTPPPPPQKPTVAPSPPKPAPAPQPPVPAPVPAPTPPPPPSAPMPKKDSSPDVPDWLKAE